MCIPRNILLWYNLKNALAGISFLLSIHILQYSHPFFFLSSFLLQIGPLTNVLCHDSDHILNTYSLIQLFVYSVFTHTPPFTYHYRMLPYISFITVNTSFTFTRSSTYAIVSHPSSISNLNTESYKTFHSVGSMTDPCGTPQVNHILMLAAVSSLSTQLLSIWW